MRTIRILMQLIFLFSMFLTFGCSTHSGPNDTLFAAKKVVYLKNNIHVQKTGRDYKASYANWVSSMAGHFVLPVNTPVEIKKWKRGFIIKNHENGMNILFEFNQVNMGMSINEYLQIITSPAMVPLTGLSKIDLKGIKDGTAYIGMSKKGIQIALGYPATHRTPSLTENRWTYWRNRFVTMRVEFDQNGKVRQIW